MSLDDLLWKRLHFQNVIMKCLSIESVEYCYFIPIVLQLADYWGDRKIAYLCKIMSRQVKQHLNHATHIHLLLSLPFRDLEGKRSRKGKSLKDFLQDYHYANADDVVSLAKQENSVKNKQQYWHVLLDKRFKNFFKSRNLNYLMEASNEKYSCLPDLTFFYLLSHQKGPLLQRSQVKELLKQQNLREKLFFSFGYVPKKQKGTKKENIDNQKLTFSFKISSKNSFEENFQLFDQNISNFPFSPKRFPVMSEPLALNCFQKDNQINIFTLANQIKVSDQTLSFHSCLNKGKILKEKKRELFSVDFQEKIISSHLQNIDNSFFQVLENINSKGFEKQDFDNNFFNHSFFSSSGSFPLSYLTPIHRILSEIQGSKGHIGSQIEKSFDYLEWLRQKRINKIVKSISTTYKKDIYFMFLQLLRDRKIWKAEQWYPFVSTVFLNSRFFSYNVSSFDSSYFSKSSLASEFPIRKKKDFHRIERQLPQSFIKFSQSEKEISQLITILINKSL